MDIIKFIPRLSNPKNIKTLSSKNTQSSFSLKGTQEKDCVHQIEHPFFFNFKDPVFLGYKGLDVLSDLQLSLLSNEPNTESLKKFAQHSQQVDQESFPEELATILQLITTRVYVEIAKSEV